MGQINLVPGADRDFLQITLQPEIDNVAKCGTQLHEAALDGNGILQRDLSDVEYAIANAVNECFDGLDGLEDATMRLHALTGLIEEFRLRHSR